MKPFPNPPTHEPAIEIQEFPSENSDDIRPHVGYRNHIYIYPKYLNYENQKSFSRARNLVCTVELRDSDCENSNSLRVFYSRPGSGGLTSSISTVVLHHNTFPEWGDELKLALPHNLTPSHHILFTIAHVAIEGAKAGKKEEPVETVGYAWMPLLNKGRIITEEQTLPVAAHLPTNYLAIEPLGLGKGFSGPEVRWIDSQKNVFKVGLRLVSTVLSSDQHLHNFFTSSSSLVHLMGETPQPASSSASKITHVSDQETVKNLKALLALEVETTISFLPTLLNQLLCVLLSSGSAEVTANVTKVLVYITHQLYEAGREDILQAYLKYVMNISVYERRTVHEELCKSLAQLLQPSNMDQLTTNKILLYAQFFFSFVIRSMAIHLLTTARIKMVRNERFSEEYHSTVRSVVELVTTLIVHR